MNLKKVVLVVFLGSAILGATTVVKAAPQDEILGSTNGLGGTSHGYIKLTPGDVTVGPVAPVKPTTPKGDTGNAGPLTIDNVAPLLFDTHKLEGKEQVYTSSVVGSNVQVTDNRGEEAGWSVQVSQTQFKDVVDPLKILKGAKLTLPVGTIETAGTNVSLQPMVYAVEVNETPVTLINAAKGSGAGTWVNTFAEKDLKLTVPAGNRNGEYMSTVTWSLTDAPK